MKSSAWLFTLSRHTCQAGRAGEIFPSFKLCKYVVRFFSSAWYTRRSNETGRVNYGGSFSLKTLLESKKALLFSSQTKRRKTIFHGRRGNSLVESSVIDAGLWLGDTKQSQAIIRISRGTGPLRVVSHRDSLTRSWKLSLHFFPTQLTRSPGPPRMSIRTFLLRKL